MRQLGVAIIGCGLIGQKRASFLGPARLAACVDLSIERAKAIAAANPRCTVEVDWRPVIDDPEVDIVIVATSNDLLAEITLAAVKAGKHVLVEKPAGRNAQELRRVLNGVKGASSLVRVGFNHRYHPAVMKAHELVHENRVGELMFIRARYGHGGRLGYDKEWRADPAISGGGELIDQGVHLIDLCRWFLGDFAHTSGTARTFYWQMPVDDNAFLLLETADKRIAFLHCSCTEWKNVFSFEIYGRAGKIHIEGLGGSYGTERITYYEMLPEMGPPLTTAWEYPMPDSSWRTEFAEFLQDIELARQPSPGLYDAYSALNIIGNIYSGAGYDHHA